MEMTKEDARELILEWANDKLEFDVEKGLLQSLFTWIFYLFRNIIEEIHDRNSFCSCLR